MQELNELKEQMQSISLIAYEASEARHERREKRQSLFHLIVEILLILLLVGTNIGWLVYESQFETVEETTTTIEAEQGGEETNFRRNRSDCMACTEPVLAECIPRQYAPSISDSRI